MNRVIKQLIYGVFYFMILGLLGWGIYAGAKPAPTCTDGKLNQREEEIDCGGECVSCEIRRLRPILVRPVTLFRVGERTTALLEFQNPNATYGASEFRYTLTLLGSEGETIRSLERTSFIYPTEIKYMFDAEVGDAPAFAVAEVMIHPESVVWKSISEFPLARTQVRNVRVEFDPVKRQAVVTGAVSNDNPFPLRRANIVGVAMNSFGLPLAASKTLLQDIAPSEERSFRIVIPEILLDTLSERDVKLFVEAAR